MSLTLIDLPYLIRLVAQDIAALNAAINDPNTPDETRDDCGELLMAALRTETNLRNQYEAEWNPDCNYPSYQELLHI